MHNKNNLFAFGRVPAILTFQHEVAHRMTADPIDPERCRLSVMCQNYANVEYLFTLPGDGFFSIYSVSHDWGRIKAYFFMVYLMVNELWVQLCLPPFFATCPFGSLEVVGPLKWPFSALEIKMLVRSSVTIYPLRFSDVQSSKFIFNMRSTLLWTFWETVHQIILHLFHQVALSFLGLTSMSVLSAWPRFESPTSRFLKVSWIFWRELIWVVFAKKKSWQLVSQCLYLFVLNA